MIKYRKLDFRGEFMSKGGFRENSGRKKISDTDKAQFIRKSICFSTQKDLELLEKILKYGKGKSFSQTVKELVCNELDKSK